MNLWFCIKIYIASYVKYFTVPQGWNEVFVSFQGVDSAMALWLNGKFVGYSEDSCTPSEFDLTPYLVEGENKLAVQVYRFSSASWLEDQDFWRLAVFIAMYIFIQNHKFMLMIYSFMQLLAIIIKMVNYLLILNGTMKMLKN